MGRKNFLWNYIKNLLTYPVYANLLLYWWNFVVLSFVCLVIQALTGVLLAVYYNATPETAFSSVEHIMRNINYDVLIRYVHANGAAFFFLCVYLHMFRNLYYNPYLKPRELLWCIGVVILVLMILTAILGYVLFWEQISSWTIQATSDLSSAMFSFLSEMAAWLIHSYLAYPILAYLLNSHLLIALIFVPLAITGVYVLYKRGSFKTLRIISHWTDFIPLSLATALGYLSRTSIISYYNGLPFGVVAALFRTLIHWYNSGTIRPLFILISIALVSICTSLSAISANAPVDILTSDIIITAASSLLLIIALVLNSYFPIPHFTTCQLISQLLLASNLRYLGLNVTHFLWIFLATSTPIFIINALLFQKNTTRINLAIRESLIALTLTAVLFFVNEFFALELPPIHFYGLMESLFYLQLTLTFDLDKSHTATLNGKSLTNEHTKS